MKVFVGVIVVNQTLRELLINETASSLPEFVLVVECISIVQINRVWQIRAIYSITDALAAKSKTDLLEVFKVKPTDGALHARSHATNW